MNVGPRRVAAIDIGSNSTRLLVADVTAGAVTEIERRTVVTRLGRGVDLSDQLSADGIEAVCETVSDFVAIYRELGVQSVYAVATSAVRDASNGGAFIAELRERFALDAEILSGEQEARLTYLGATAGDPPQVPTLVIDIGGGSTELIVGTAAEVAFHTSLQAGVVRHSERHISTDPPTNASLEELAEDVHGLLEEAVSAHPEAHAEAGIAVAGTATSLAAIDLALDPYDPDRVHGHRLTFASVQRMLARLSTVPLAEREAITGLPVDRAPTIVAGVVMLIEVMRAFGFDELTVSEHDILHGAAISAAGTAAG